MKMWAAVLLATLLEMVPVRAESPAPYEEIPIGFLPFSSVNAALKKTLSPQGRYLILAPRGTVRIFDSKAKIEEAGRILEQLRNAPALISVTLILKTGQRRVTTQNYPPREPIHTYDIPIPRSQDSSRIVVNPGGGVTVVPGLPREFTTRRVGPGTIVNPSLTGFATLDPEVRISESGLSGGKVRKFSVTAPFGKPFAVPVSARADDLPGLREWAIRHGAVAANEPAWTAAGTELWIVPEVSGPDLILLITPQIVVTTGDAGAVRRRIALRSVTTSVMTQRGVTASIDGLSRADEEFYRVFFNASESADDTETTMSVAAGIQYLGQPAQ